jgi:hypothetical protein
MMLEKSCATVMLWPCCKLASTGSYTLWMELFVPVLGIHVIVHDSVASEHVRGLVSTCS